MHTNDAYEIEAATMYGEKVDRRKVKRAFRIIDRLAGYGAKYDAHAEGEAAAVDGKPNRNHYHPGVRHEAYNDGYEMGLAHDPMGAHHGYNV